MQKQQLAELIAQSDSMTQQLIGLRNAILNNTLNSYYKSPSAIVVEASQNRTLLRALAETLQANRNLIQIDKQKIEKSRIVLEGLEYFKKTLKDKIQGYHTDVESIEQYLEEPMGQIDWENNYESGEARLKQELEKLRAKDEDYKKKIEAKNELQRNISQKKSLYNNELPKHIKKLNDQIIETTKIFGIGTNETLEQIDNPQMAYIYDSFNTLRVNEKIDVAYGKQQYQFIDITVKPTNVQLYERVMQYKVKLEEKELKIKVSSIRPDFNKLVIGVDRRSNLSNKDLFHRLINREQAAPIFEEAVSENQRNLNSKYVQVSWLEDILCASSVESAQFLELLRLRIFAATFVKYIFDNIRNPTWLSTLSSLAYAEFTNKKLSVQQHQKITFLQMRQLVPLPNIYKKALNNYEEQLRKLAMGSQTLEFKQYMQNTKNTLLKLLHNVCMEEILTPDLYQYHKLLISYSGLKVQCVVLVPYGYPSMPPRIKILSFQRAGESEVLSNSFATFECLARIDNKVIFTEEMEQVEREANSAREDTRSEPFKLIFSLSKLFQAICEAQQAYLDRKKSSK